MRTRLYNTETGELGRIRDGNYLVDGQPGVLPPNMVELEVVVIEAPEYNEATQMVERREYVDLPTLRFVYEYYIRDLTEQELLDRIPKPPERCTPRQFRLALVESSIDIEGINTMIGAIENEVDRKKAQIEWEYATEIYRYHPLIVSFGQLLSMSESEIDAIFQLAKTFP
jgi:hypothetical protein